MARTVAGMSLVISSRTEKSSIPTGIFLPAASANGAAAVAARKPRRERGCRVMPKTLSQLVRRSILESEQVLLRTHLRRAGALAGSLAVLSAVYALQRPFRELPGVEYTKFPLPRDYQEKTEWAFARLMYPPVGRINGGFELYGSWKEGGSNWTMDYPRSDRHVTPAVRR